MSTLVIDTIQGKTTAGSVNVRGEGSNNTNLQQGLAKSWVNLDGTDSGAAARDSFNVASTTDVGTGNYSCTFTNNMSNDDYANNVTGRGSTIVFGSINDGKYATSTVGIYLFNTSGSLTDATYAITSVHGDLA